MKLSWKILGLVGILALIVVLTGITLMGQPVSGNFNTVNMGIGGGGNGSDAYAPSMPASQNIAVEAPGVRLDANEQKSYDAASNPVVAQERLVIQNAELTIVIVDPKAKMEAVTAMAEQMGGFVVSSSMYETSTPGGSTAPEGNITIRVPADKLNDALTQIKNGTVEVRNENRTGQDVTDQYTDLKSRLKNYEAAEQELTRLMEKAEKAEDVVAIFQQLAYYREQIEVTRGQMQYFEQAAALSAITVHLIAEQSALPLEVGGWKPEGVAREAIQDLIYFWQNFVDWLIRLALYVLPSLLTLGLACGLPIWLVILGVRAIVRRGKAHKPTTTEVEAKKE